MEAKARMSLSRNSLDAQLARSVRIGRRIWAKHRWFIRVRRGLFQTFWTQVSRGSNDVLAPRVFFSQSAQYILVQWPTTVYRAPTVACARHTATGVTTGPDSASALPSRDKSGTCRHGAVDLDNLYFPVLVKLCPRPRGRDHVCRATPVHRRRLWMDRSQFDSIPWAVGGNRA
jgi:hypothetical protein